MPSFQYLLFYKPYQVLCQFSKEGDKKTLADFMPDIDKNIYPVGRLDYDSEGLLLLTNDTAMNKKLLHPTQAHSKTYYVQVEGIPTTADLQKLKQGVTININGKPLKTAPAKAFIIDDLPSIPERNPPIRYRKNIPTTWIGLTISEGKNRQVRRMTAAIGFPTLRLIRYCIGTVSIGSLQPGTFLSLNAKAVASLFHKA